MTNANNINQQIALAEAQLKNAYTRYQVVKAANRLTDLHRIRRRFLAFQNI